MSDTDLLVYCDLYTLEWSDTEALQYNYGLALVLQRIVAVLITKRVTRGTGAVGMAVAADVSSSY